MTSAPLDVLLVEDSLAEADLVRAILGSSSSPGYRVEHVPRLSAAMERLAEASYHVILLDLNLPDSLGLEGFEKLRSTAASVPVIILSNVSDEGVARRAVHMGAQDYLIKREVDEKLLRHAIRYGIERRRTQQALRESEERYSLAVAGANDGVWDWDLTRDQAYFSHRWKDMIGYGDAEIGASIEEWFGRVHEQDLEALKAALAEHLQGRSQHFEVEHRIRTRDGGYLWVLSRGLAVRHADGNAYRMAGSLSDISQRKQAESRLVHDALHDALTGLPNRSLYMDRLGLALRQYQREPARRFAVLYFDLNRFKYINDSLGHSVGDELLVAVARRLEKFLRPGDTLGRLGGDEFAVLLHDVDDIPDVTLVASRVHELLSREFLVVGHEVYTSASIGIALACSSYRTPEEVLRDADLAMYKAKHSGSTSFEVFDGEMHASAMAQLKLETDLRRAMERHEFVIHYQPIVSLDTGRIMSFEALLRWQHPQRGLLPPAEFIQAAEETGLIVPLGWWVLEEACTQTREWQRLFPTDPPIGISINISGKVFMKPDMAARLLRLLKDCRIACETVRLEITESAIMDHEEAALAELHQLREAGVELHLDDFGTGFSSLSYLQRFSYNTIKIDRSFVRHMTGPGETSAIVKTIVGLGKMLNMNVIAEGVETREQLHSLRELDCPEAQGFWFSEPLDGSAVRALLGNGRLKN